MSSFLGHADYAPLTSSKSPTRGFTARVRQYRDQADAFNAKEMAALTKLTDAQTRSAIAALIKSGELEADPIQWVRYRWKK